MHAALELAERDLPHDRVDLVLDLGGEQDAAPYRVGLLAQEGLERELLAEHGRRLGERQRRARHQRPLPRRQHLVDAVPELVEAEEQPRLREAVLRYSRDVAFAAAAVYARAAEQRGGWDARLESLVVHAVVRGEADETLASRAAELGWEDVTGVVVVAGSPPNTVGSTNLIRVHEVGTDS